MSDMQRATMAEESAKSWQAIADDETKSKEEREDARAMVKKKTDWAAYHRDQAASNSPLS
jgi:hypothetical protein